MLFQLFFESNFWTKSNIDKFNFFMLNFHKKISIIITVVAEEWKLKMQPAICNLYSGFRSSLVCIKNRWSLKKNNNEYVKHFFFCNRIINTSTFFCFFSIIFWKKLLGKSKYWQNRTFFSLILKKCSFNWRGPYIITLAFKSIKIKLHNPLTCNRSTDEASNLDSCNSKNNCSCLFSLGIVTARSFCFLPGQTHCTEQGTCRYN